MSLCLYNWPTSGYVCVLITTTPQRPLTINWLSANFGWNVMTSAPIGKWPILDSDFVIILHWWGGMRVQNERKRNIRISGDIMNSLQFRRKTQNPQFLNLTAWAFPWVGCSRQKLSLHWLPVVHPSALESSIHICHTDLNTTQRQNWREETHSPSLNGGYRRQWYSTLIVAAWRYQHWRHLARPGLGHMRRDTVIDIFPSWHFLSVYDTCAGI